MSETNNQDNPDHNDQHLGKLLREYRELNQYTLSDVSSVLDISKESLRKIETGEVKNASVMTWLKLAVFLDIPKELVWDLVKDLESEDLSRARKAIRRVSFLEMYQQETLVDIANNGGLNRIEYLQTVYCDPCQRPIKRRIHALEMIRPILSDYDVSRIKAFDKDGELPVEILEHESHSIKFFVHFKKPVSQDVGLYTYSWRAESVPNVFNFIDLGQTSLDFSWFYAPFQKIREYRLIIRHPEKFFLSQIDELRKVKRLVESFDIEPKESSLAYQALSSDVVENDRIETRLVASNLDKGLYKFQWQYGKRAVKISYASDYHAGDNATSVLAADEHSFNRR